MLIKIDNSVLQEALYGANAKFIFNILNKCATAQRERNHIIWAEEGIFRELAKMSDLSSEDRNCFSALAEDSRVNYNKYKQFKISAKIIFDDKIVSERIVKNGRILIVINCFYFLNSLHNFQFLNPTILLSENDNDWVLLSHIVKNYVIRNNPSFSFEIDGIGKGGSQLFTGYKNQINNARKRLCLCIADNDDNFDRTFVIQKKWVREDGIPNSNNTWVKIKTLDDEIKPYHCFCYQYLYVSEIENLIPLIIYKNSCIIESSIDYDKIPLHFFDIKAGVVLKKQKKESKNKIKQQSEKEYVYNQYWKSQLLSIFPNIEERLLTADIVIKGFKDNKGQSSNLLKYIIENPNTDWNIIEKGVFEGTQMGLEYNQVGDLFFYWCCTKDIRS